MKRNRTGPQPAGAFTLIELLVFIAIIAILAAILFPVFATAREKARQTACLSNMKQLALGLVQYTQDYDETLPNGANPYDYGNGWAGQLYTYVKSTQVYVCPSDTSPLPPMSSYGYNSNCVVPGAAYTGIAGGYYPVGRSISTFLSPARTVLLFECQNNGGSSGTNYSIGSPQYQAGSDIYPSSAGYQGSSPAGYGHPGNAGANELSGNGTSTKSLQYATGVMSWSNNDQYFTAPFGRHSNGANFVLADGHAKWMMPAQVVVGTTQTSATYCGPTQLTYWAAAATSCSYWAATFSTI